ncbi:hypothetical protein [Amnibacterium setariae]|uniref:Uncharacterized protein n=1 Tax=Amnibacterium setariae TaxID=2306585 RepID=A0A3A1TVT6_9MICO|nr:hypothetical protein [Amnibacterium setariae]RIX27909.1 hypothetical protein D1781_10305 [Amnibacterium setariae]
MTQTTEAAVHAAAPGAGRVWDLADTSAGRAVRRRGWDHGGPLAATLGLVALGGAFAPDIAVETRWTVVGAAGLVALLVAGSAVRRRQALLSLLLAFAGLVTPLAAGAVATAATLAQPPVVTSTVVPDRALPTAPQALVASDAFAERPADEQEAAREFATALVLRLRTVHGAFGPYPAALRLSNGSVVEAAGAMQGTSLGAVPRNARLEYRVTRSGGAFAVSVVAGGAGSAGSAGSAAGTGAGVASVTATSALVVAGDD